MVLREQFTRQGPLLVSLVYTSEVSRLKGIRLISVPSEVLQMDAKATPRRLGQAPQRRRFE